MNSNNSGLSLPFAIKKMVENAFNGPINLRLEAANSNSHHFMRTAPKRQKKLLIMQATFFSNGENWGLY